MYPLEILPKIGYNICIKSEILENENGLFLNRRSNSNFKNTFDDNGILRKSALEPKEFPGMSLNLIGFHFRSSYSKYRPLKPGTDSWGGKFVSYYKFRDKFTIESDCCNIFLPFNELHGCTFNYEFPVHTPLDPDHKKFIQENKITDNFSFEGKIELIHNPTLMNYWHFELKLLNQFKEIKNINSQIARYYIDDLIANIISVQAVSDISEIDFIKTKSNIYKS